MTTRSTAGALVSNTILTGGNVASAGILGMSGRGELAVQFREDFKNKNNNSIQLMGDCKFYKKIFVLFFFPKLSTIVSGIDILIPFLQEVTLPF